jgi:hypothetical protein
MSGESHRAMPTRSGQSAVRVPPEAGKVPVSASWATVGQRRTSRGLDGSLWKPRLTKAGGELRSRGRVRSVQSTLSALTLMSCVAVTRSSP